jgi:hypothetical protein
MKDFFISQIILFDDFQQQGKRLADESGETHSVKRQKTDTLSEGTKRLSIEEAHDFFVSKHLLKSL